MPKKKDYPKNFCEFGPPHFYKQKPNEILINTQKIEENSYSNYSKIFETDDEVTEIQIFDSDEMSDSEVKITRYKKIKTLNKKYQEELSDYQKALKKHEEELAEWKKWKAKWDKENQAEQEKRERKMLEQLQRKYKNK